MSLLKCMEVDSSRLQYPAQYQDQRNTPFRPKKKGIKSRIEMLSTVNTLVIASIRALRYLQLPSSPCIIRHGPKYCDCSLLSNAMRKMKSIRIASAS